jgi:hypothetical protein
MPDYRDVRVNVTLTNVIRDYKFQDQQFAADIVAPPVQVVSSIGTYKTLGRELLSTQHSDALGGEGELTRIGYEMGSATYECLPYGLKMLVTDREIRQSPPGFDPMRQAAITLLHGLKLREELRIATLAAVAGTPVNYSTPSNDWDHADATIVTDINAAKVLFKANMGGRGPTHFLFGDHVANEIVNQIDLSTLVVAAAALNRPLDLLNTAFSGDDLPPRIFGMQKIVPSVYHNTALIGATEALANIWDQDAYMFLLSSDLQGATWAHQFRLTDAVVRQWRSEDPSGWWVAAEWEVDEVEVNANAKWRFIDIT